MRSIANISNLTVPIESVEDEKVIEDCSKEGLQYLESNPDASAEDYEAKQKELEAKFSPIM